MKKIKIIVVAGARPNFIKVAALLKEFKKHPRFLTRLVHTGQHYDYKMSSVFFRDLHIPKPDFFLKAPGGSTHTAQTAAIMISFEKVLSAVKPDLVLVVGDVNSTVACALTASKMGILIAHVEAGLRSFDRSMPEEINRLVTDQLSDFLFITEASAQSNLKREGISAGKIFFTGNVMIDTLKENMPAIIRVGQMKSLGLVRGEYCVMTLHRPSNVDSKAGWRETLDILYDLCSKIKVVFPIHPRSKKMLEKHGLWQRLCRLPNMKIISPLGYIDFLNLVMNSTFVLTDSGGIQEETTYLKIPCLTMRRNTERPVTLSQGSNVLVGQDKKRIKAAVAHILHGGTRLFSIPALWDGKASSRIVKILLKASSLNA